MNKLATLIIINYNDPKKTIKCLNSLKKQTYRNFDIILIDNGSKYNLYLELKNELQQYKNYLKISFIRNNSNLYFTIANNKAMKVAKGEYICLLNNDTVVMADFVEKMITFLEDHPDAYMISPKIKVYREKDYLWYAGAEVDLRKLDIVRIRGLWESDPKNEKYNKPSITGYIAGAAVFVRREILDKVGLLDEILFMYHDDPDWSLRAKKMGYNIYYVPTTTIYHDCSRTIKSSREGFYQFLIIRNSQIMVWKHGTLRDLIIYYGRYFFYHGLDFFSLIKKKKFKIILIRINATLSGFKIGLKRRTHRSCRRNFFKDYKYIQKIQNF